MFQKNNHHQIKDCFSKEKINSFQIRNTSDNKTHLGKNQKKFNHRKFKINYLQLFSNQDQIYSYYLGQGNNPSLIRRVMEKRPNWIQTQQNSSMFVKFKWQTNTRGIKYDKLIPNISYKSIVNHFQNHHELSNKKNLLKNMELYCCKNKKNVYEYIPPTFILDLNDQTAQSVVSDFVDFYIHNHPRIKAQDIKRKSIEYKRKLKHYFICVGHIQKKIRSGLYRNQVIMKQSFIDRRISSYLWILKPTFLNRGKGIQVFDDINYLVELLRNYINGFYQKSFIQSKGKIKQSDNKGMQTKYSEGKIKIDQTHEKKETKKLETNKEHKIQKDQKEVSKDDLKEEKKIEKISKLMRPSLKINQIKKKQRNKNIHFKENMAYQIFSLNKSYDKQKLGNFVQIDSFIVQKYLEVISFNRNHYSLITENLILEYMYCLTTNLIFTCLNRDMQDFQVKDIANQFIHLTNNSIQKYSKRYGQKDNGNMQSFNDIKIYISQHNSKFDFNQDVINSIKQIIIISMKSVAKKFNNKRKFCFEIFGYDFILDQNGRPWLLQVNTNPDIEQNSGLLVQLLPRMIHDAFRLTIDHIFPIPSQGYSMRPFRLFDYKDSQNLFQYLGNLIK